MKSRYPDKKIPMTVESFGAGSQDTGTSYAEGPWFYARNGLYYMVYAAFGVDKKIEHLAYSTSDGPTGPWKYGGVLMNEDGGSVCVTEFKYNEDGSIDMVPKAEELLM